MDVETAQWQKAIAEAVAAEREACAKLVDQRQETADTQAALCLGTDEDKAVIWRSRAIEAEETAVAIRSRPATMIQAA
jgi:hypothetical protein